MGIFDDPQSRGLNRDDLITIVAALVHQLGGSVVLDSADFLRARNENKTFQVQTQNDPWQLILREVDN